MIGKTADILLVLLVAFAAQDVSSRLDARFDTTSRGLYSLSELTRNLLDGLQGEPLSATVFMEEDEFGREEAGELLARYKAAYGRLDFRFVSPAKNPGAAAVYGVGSHGTTVWEWKGRREKSSGFSEEAFSDAVRRLVHPRRPVVYFLAGHGEKSLKGDYGAVGRRLEEEGRVPRELLLPKEGGVPEDAACVVAAGPKAPLAAREIEILDAYVRKGGRLLLLLDPFQDGGFTDFLGRLGIGLRDDAVVDPRGRMFGGDLLFPMAVEYPSHPVTRGLDGVCIFPVARSLSVLPPAGPRVETRVVARTSPEAWAETDRASLAAGRPVFDPASDAAGPVALAVSAGLLADYPDRDGAVLAAGDSDFAANTYVSAARNMSFFLDSLAWLIGPEEVLGVRPVEPGHHPILLSRGQGIFLGWLALVIVPGAAALLGVRAWLKRRRAP